MSVVVDSSIIIDHLRTKKLGKTTYWETITKKEQGLYFSLISVGELFGGESAVRDETDIRRMFSFGNIIPLEFSLMESAGEIRRTAKINLIDAIIAATCLTLDFSLATLNTKDFTKVSGIKLYKLPD